MGYVGGGVDGVRGPFLHCGAVDGCFVVLERNVRVEGKGKVGDAGAAYVKRHPRDGLVMGNLGALDEVESELFIVKGKGKDGAWGRPCADHEMMDRHCDAEAENLVLEL